MNNMIMSLDILIIYDILIFYVSMQEKERMPKIQFLVVFPAHSIMVVGTIMTIAIMVIVTLEIPLALSNQLVVGQWRKAEMDKAESDDTSLMRDSGGQFLTNNPAKESLFSWPIKLLAYAPLFP